MFESFKNYLSQKTSGCGLEDPAVFQELLFYFYMEHYSSDTPEAAAAYRELEQSLEPFPFAQADPILSAANYLCAERMRAAFHEGLRFGLHLQDLLEEL